MTVNSKKRLKKAFISASNVDSSFLIHFILYIGRLGEFIETSQCICVEVDEEEEESRLVLMFDFSQYLSTVTMNRFCYS